LWYVNVFIVSSFQFNLRTIQGFFNLLTYEQALSILSFVFCFSYILLQCLDGLFALWVTL